MAIIKKDKEEPKKRIRKPAAVKSIEAAAKPAADKEIKPKTRRRAVSKENTVLESPKPPALRRRRVVKKEQIPVAPIVQQAKEETRIEAKPIVPAVEKIIQPPPLPAIVKEPKIIELEFPVTVKDLAVKMQEKPSVLIKTLLNMKVIAGLNQLLDEQTVTVVSEKYGFKIKKALSGEELALQIHKQEDDSAVLEHRPPVVTLMGHVDHGKTSLLDAIRKSKVVDREHGGITQHIGAYRITQPHGDITFLDTPGHEAFTAMRARGAKITDIVVLVVAADDGIMPQTIEAIDHARAAGVSIIAAINKIDKPQADIERVKKQLGELNLLSEDWGGKTITVPVSAKTGEGIDDLLEMILLEAQMLELKANPNRPANGVVIEAKMNKTKGPVVTLLVQNGSLNINDNVIVGSFYGKIRAMFDDRGKPVTTVLPAFPVEVLGLSGVPQAGEQFFVIEDEKKARELALTRQEKERLQEIKTIKRISLEDLHSQIKEGKLKELKLIIKADVQGSLEAIRQTLLKLNVSEIKLSIIHEAVGNINSSDVILAAASDALILGFNVTPDEPSKELIAKEGIDVKTYNIIYELANDIKAAIEGMLEPKLKKVFLGRVEVRQVFKLSRSGLVAGCFVTKGKVTRSSQISLVRNGQVVFEGNIASLKRFKEDVREVSEGFECGITLAGFDDIKEGDVIEAYEIEKIARKLD